MGRGRLGREEEEERSRRRYYRRLSEIGRAAARNEGAKRDDGRGMGELKEKDKLTERTAGFNGTEEEEEGRGRAAIYAPRKSPTVRGRRAIWRVEGRDTIELKRVS